MSFFWSSEVIMLISVLPLKKFWVILECDTSAKSHMHNIMSKGNEMSKSSQPAVEEDLQNSSSHLGPESI